MDIMFPYGGIAMAAPQKRLLPVLLFSGTFVILCVVPFRADAGQLVLSLENQRQLKLEYCWITKEKVKFEIPGGGGTASLRVEEVKALEEITRHEEIDTESLRKTAITVERFDPLAYTARVTSRYGLQVKFEDQLPTIEPINFSNKPRLVGPVTQDYFAIKQFVNPANKVPVFLVAVFFNSREPINPDGTYFELLDMDENLVATYPAILKQVSVIKKRHKVKRIGTYSYMAYALIPIKGEFWAYNLKVIRMQWDSQGTETNGRSM